MSQDEKNTPTDYVILEDNSQYFYSVHPFELKNSLGTVAAILREFVFVKSGDETGCFSYRLYKTKDGNWYDITNLKSAVDYNILRLLKTAMDAKENVLKS